MEKKGWHSHSLSERESPDSCLDRLLLLFWVYYMEDDPHLLKHRFALGGYLLQIAKERMLLTTSKKKDICKCKWLNWLYSILGRFSIDFRKLL